MNRPAETWRPVVGYETRYEVSDQGRVRRVGRKRCLRPEKHWRGYLRVQLYGGAGVKQRHHRVHHLVAAAFIGPRPAGFTVDHVDENKRNNRAGNLEYCGQVDNYLRHVGRERARRAAALAAVGRSIASRDSVIVVARAAA